jgi:hypothetical protein
MTASPGAAGQPCVEWCRWRSVSATRRPVGRCPGWVALQVWHHHQASANGRPSTVGIGTGQSDPGGPSAGGVRPSQARSAWLLAPRRPTARVPRMRRLHTSLATPPASGSMRTASSPQS